MDSVFFAPFTGTQVRLITWEQTSQRLVHVLNQIVRILYNDRQANMTARNAQACAVLRPHIIKCNCKGWQVSDLLSSRLLKIPISCGLFRMVNAAASPPASPNVSKLPKPNICHKARLSCKRLECPRQLIFLFLDARIDTYQLSPRSRFVLLHAMAMFQVILPLPKR